LYRSASLLKLFSFEDTPVYRPDFRYTDIENDSKLSPLIEAASLIRPYFHYRKGLLCWVKMVFVVSPLSTQHSGVRAKMVGSESE